MILRFQLKEGVVYLAVLVQEKPVAFRPTGRGTQLAEQLGIR